MKKILYILAFGLAVSCVFAEDQKLFNFADSLFDSGDYYRAIAEYKRYMFYNPGGRFADKAALKIGLSYMQAEKWDGAIEALENADSNYGAKVKESALLLESFAYAGKKDYAYSDMLLSKAAADFGSAAAAEKALYLQAYNRVYTKNWTEALGLFKKINTAGDMKNSALSAAALMEKSAEIQERNAIASALFSAVLPGAGYYYCGRWADGFFATAFNALFIYNTYNAFAKNDSTMKFIYGIPAVIFYLANIYGSAVAANKFNDDETGKFIKSADAYKIDFLSQEF